MSRIVNIEHARTAADEILIEFDEPMNGLSTTGNYSITEVGVGALTVNTATPNADDTAVTLGMAADLTGNAEHLATLTGITSQAGANPLDFGSIRFISLFRANDTLPDALVDITGTFQIQNIIPPAQIIPPALGLIIQEAFVGLFTVTVTVLTPTSIRCTFNTPMKNTPALLNIDTYSISPTLQIFSVTPEGVTNPNYVDLAISEMRTGTSYTLTVDTAEPA